LLPIGYIRNIDFRLVDTNSNPVPGRTLSVWGTSPNQIFLLRNGAACADAFTLHDYGDGRYTITYSPSAPGHDYFLLYDSATDIRIIDIEDVVRADFATGGIAQPVALDHNYGSPDALRLTGVSNPADFSILVFVSSDWDQNHRSDADAVGMSSLNGDGRWLKQILVTAGTYHIVARTFRQVLLMKVYLEVS